MRKVSCRYVRASGVHGNVELSRSEVGVLGCTAIRVLCATSPHSIEPKAFFWLRI